jgi:dynamin 1-like protein
MSNYGWSVDQYAIGSLGGGSGSSSSSSSQSGDATVGMDQLIPVINKLQDVFNALGGDVPIDLPQIVVVGSQSSGKSSVLENIVGRDFLPRGSGIVTRRPLVLQLVHKEASSSSSGLSSAALSDGEKMEEWGEFLHKPGEVFYNFAKIREEIARETDRLTGKNKGISSQPINLKIVSPHVLNLTLVDLPGMTRVPVGDQPADIEVQIRHMIYQYVQRKNALILAVTPANTDIATSDAIQLAREVDPDGARTLGVLTKLDLMDKGTDALDILLGRVVQLKLGFVGVINRSQQDIVANTPIREAVKNETKFFAEHPGYRRIADRLGTPYLSRTLNKRLLLHIRNTLPELKNRISAMMAEAQQEMLTYGDPLLEDQKGALLLQVITKFSTEYRDAIDGKSRDLSIHELFGGARINFIFNEIFGKCIDGFDPLDGLTMNDIRTAIRNATGPRTALFIPEDSFELLVKRQISRLEEPALQCVHYVFDELQRIVTQIEAKDLVRFGTLRERVVGVMNSLLNKCRSPTKTMITDLIAMEMAYVNTSHPDFVGGSGAINSVLSNMAANYQQQQQTYQEDGADDWQASSSSQQQLTSKSASAIDSSSSPPSPSSSSPSAAGAADSVPRAQQPQRRQQPPSRSQPPSSGGQDANGQGSFFNMFFGKDKQQQSSSSRRGRAAEAYDSRARQQQMLAEHQARERERQQREREEREQQQQQQQMQRRQQQQQHHHQAVRTREKLEDVPVSIKAGMSPNDKERFETELIQSLMVSYFDIVRKNVKDLVPKSCMHFLVNQSKAKVQSELIHHLYKPDLFDELLEESPEIAQRRSRCRLLLDTLTRANRVLNEVRDITL